VLNGLDFGDYGVVGDVNGYLLVIFRGVDTQEVLLGISLISVDLETLGRLVTGENGLNGRFRGEESKMVIHCHRVRNIIIFWVY